MRTEIKSSTTTGLQGQIDYRKLTLLQLAERIANNSDMQALRELHENRVIFHPKWKNMVHLAEYLSAFKDSDISREWCGHEALVLDEAYDLTVDKFSNIPSGQTDDEQPGPYGPDCRYYFKAYIIYLTAEFKARPPANALQAEMIAAEMLRRMVVRQFYFSCLEAKRKEYKFVRRYRCRSPWGDIYLWLPFEIPPQRCREWLQANIPDIDPRRPGERERVQAVLNQLLAKREIFSLNELEQIGERLPPSLDPWLSMIEENISVDGLAEAVAGEKAENINQQRTAIRMLGKDKLKQLIHTIFTKLAYGEYVEKEIAESFGLSTATFSRFAGSQWKEPCDDIVVTFVPDLWRNTAHTLAGHLDFVIAAQKAGVWKHISYVLHVSNKIGRVKDE